MALTQKQIEWLAEMKAAEEAAKAKRLAQLAARTPEEIERAKAIREQEIRTQELRSAPHRQPIRQPIHLQDEE